LAEFRLAKVFAGEARYSEAGQLLAHAIAVDEKTWPGGHFLLGDSWFQLAEVERAEHRYAEAEVNYQKAIVVYEKSGASTSPGLASALRQYASLLKIGRREEARALEKRAQQVQRSVQAFQ